MRTLLIIFFLFFSSVLYSFSQIETSDSLNRIDSYGKKQGHWRKFENDTLKYDGFFKDDLPTGEFKYYYGNGRIKAIVKFTHSHLCMSTMYHPNGVKMAEGNFLDNLKDGTWNYYNESGILVSEECYDQGKKISVWKTFLSDGTLSEEITYYNGYRQGPWRQFFPEGRPKLIGSYKEDMKDGPFQLFYPNQEKLLTGFYINDQREGEWLYYLEDGSLQKKRTYKNGYMTNEVIYIEMDEDKE
jgi:antitoxin component YwqK of YwqJK toxin-antitoxin module